MTSDFVKRILEKINRPDLLHVLVNDLTGSELNSILLEVFHHKLKSITPPELLNLYQANRLVKPADLPVLEMKRMELEILELFEKYLFHPIDLAPVSALGSCSVPAHVDQKKILSAVRGTEVLADSTNAIALHVCDLIQGSSIATETTKFCNIQRMLRTQSISGKGFRPHFRVGCLVTCGKDTGSYSFEKTALHDHLLVMKSLFLGYYKMDNLRFRLLGRSGYPKNFLSDVTYYLVNNITDTEIAAIDQSEKENLYYKGIQYKVDISYKGKTFEIADGGFVDWTQQILQNKKERMLTSGFGFDLMYRILHDEL